MRLQVVEPDARFTCGSCTACCDQPWRTVIEAERAQALDRHDWGRYPQLAAKKFYHPTADGRPGFFDLAKGEGTRCLFLDTDGLCIIHKELGPAAKPAMCRQFPFLPSPTAIEARISLNYGCPSVQERRGSLLVEQTADIAEVIPKLEAASDENATTPLDDAIRLPRAEADALFERAMAIFDDRRQGDIWNRFAELMALLFDVRREKMGGAPTPSTPPEIRSFTNPVTAPLGVRFLFAATMFPDLIPADTTSRMGFVKRLTLIPKMLSLAKLSGGYASRLLARNVSIDEVLRHPVEPQLAPAATELLLRYFRSRFWHRTTSGTRLSVIAGVHQHICDFNAILFFARAEAQHSGEANLTEARVRRGLTLVEFHLANQSRLFEQTLKGWLKGQLGNLAVAAQSLRLMSINPCAVVNTSA